MTVDDLEMDYKNDFAIYCFPDTKQEVFRYHVPTLDSFKMTVEEKAHAVKLCLEARLNGGWTGDILQRSL